MKDEKIQTPIVKSKHLISYRENIESEWKQIIALMYEINESFDINDDLFKQLREIYSEENVTIERLELTDLDQSVADHLYEKNQLNKI